MVRLIIFSLFALTAACTPNIGPKTGGPCNYESMDILAEVTGYTEYGVELMDPLENAPFDMPEAAFETMPELGEVISIRKESITKGTCTPVMYFLAEPAGPSPQK